jgi:hypothetical protein
LRERKRPCEGAFVEPVVFRLKGFESVGGAAGGVDIPAALEGWRRREDAWMVVVEGVVIGDVGVELGSADDRDCWVYKDEILESILGIKEAGCARSRIDGCAGNDRDSPPGTPWNDEGGALLRMTRGYAMDVAEAVLEAE